MSRTPQNTRNSAVDTGFGRPSFNDWNSYASATPLASSSRETLPPLPQYALDEIAQPFNPGFDFVPPGFEREPANSVLVQSTQAAANPEFPSTFQNSTVPRSNQPSTSSNRTPNVPQAKDSSQPPKKRARTSKKKTNPPSEPTLPIIDYNSLLAEGQDTIAENRRTKSTSKIYAGQLKMLQAWLENYNKSRTPNSVDLSDALTTLSDKTTTLIKMYWTFRSHTIGFGSIEASRSALKAYFEKQFPDDGYVSASDHDCAQLEHLLIEPNITSPHQRKEWTCKGGRWEGNPLCDGTVQDLFLSFKKKHGRTHDPKQVSAYDPACTQPSPSF